MQIDQAHFVGLLQNFESNRSKVLTAITTFFAAVEEGFNKAEQYEALARKSRTASLAALGLSREDLPRFVIFGKTCASTSASTSRSKQLPKRKG